MFLRTSKHIYQLLWLECSSPLSSKIESFIRSKYESRRWALDGPPPEDPSVLDSESATADRLQEHPPAAPISLLPTNALNKNQPTRRPASPVLQPPLSTRPPHASKLLSAAVADLEPQNSSASTHRSALPQTTAPPPDDSLFNLDFHAPTPVSTNPNSLQPKRDVKQDILSLFSAPSVTASQPSSAFSALGQLQEPSAQQSLWDPSNNTQTQRALQATSMIGMNGVGQWGASSGWSGPTIPPAQGNLWGNQPPAQHQSALTGGTRENIWGSTNLGQPSSEEPFGTTSTKQDDVFGDLWGGFK